MGMSKKLNLLVYNCHIYKIGGIETFIKNFVKRLHPWYSLTVAYEDADADQIERIKPYAKVERYIGQTYKTDICLWVSSWGKRPIDKVSASKHYQMIHADWEKLKARTGETFPLQDEIDEYIAVGKETAKAFTRLTGKKATVIHNLLNLDDIKTQRVLKLITVSRIGREKGFERMVEIALELKKHGYPFMWYVYGDIPDENYKVEIKNKLLDIPEVIFMGPKLDLASYIKDCDYLVQVSDTEAFCYSIYEALQLEVPVIATDFPSAFEQIKDGKNGYILKMDLSNLDIHKIYHKIPTQCSFTEFASEENWLKMFKDVKKNRKRQDLDVSLRDKQVQGRGFLTYQNAVDYSKSVRFKNLGKCEQNEFNSWLNTI